MSAVPHRHGPHVRELFLKNGSAPLAAGSFEKAEKESRKSYDMSGKKKRQGRGQPSSGLGQYKPKILSRDGAGAANIPVNHGHSVADVAVPPSQSRQHWHSGDTAHGPAATDGMNNGGGAKSRPFIMGDKDVPLVLHSSADATDDLELGVDDLSLTTGKVTRDDGNIGTENPLFSRQEARRNVPLPERNDTYSAFQDVPVPVKNGRESEPTGVFIPAPDYDEEEKTLVFSDEPDDDDDELFSSHPGKKIYREYHGEDFSQYLSDEENEFSAQPRPKRPTSLYLVTDRKSQTEAKRHYKKREAVQGKNKQKAKDKNVSGSNSLRNFSFSDSKFGSVNGNSRRLSVHSLSEDVGEAELFVNTGSSYEQFLRSKNGEDLGELFVDNSPPRSPEDQPGYRVPSRYARGPSHKKDTLWKKLTWRFKKQPKNSFDLRT